MAALNAVFCIFVIYIERIFYRIFNYSPMYTLERISTLNRVRVTPSYSLINHVTENIWFAVRGARRWSKVPLVQYSLWYKSFILLSVHVMRLTAIWVDVSRISFICIWFFFSRWPIFFHIYFSTIHWLTYGPFRVRYPRNHWAIFLSGNII